MISAAAVSSISLTYASATAWSIFTPTNLATASNLQANWTDIASQISNGYVTAINSCISEVTGLRSYATATYYVDPTTGNDSNGGLALISALLTVSAAIAKIPQILNHSATIFVGTGTVSGNITLNGYFGSGTISVVAGGSIASAADYKVNEFIDITNTNCYAYVRGFYVNGSALTSGVSGFVRSFGAMRAKYEYMALDGSGVTLDYKKGLYTENSKVKIQNCSINNMSGVSGGVAIAAVDLSEVLSYINSGTTNTIGLQANSGGIRKSGAQPSGTTAESTAGGGTID
jgi:hypothetical protein